MAGNLITRIVGSQHDRDIKALLPLLHSINGKENWAASLSPEDFPKQTERFKTHIKNGGSLDDILPEAFALVREAARRTLGERPYDVQLLGGIILHSGKITEMKTGEGKTLSSVSAAYLNALSGKGVHIITVNDYLAERDADWMRPVYTYLGISVGVIVSDMDNEIRKTAYAQDITYGTNNEFGFDYLRDNMRLDTDGRVQRSHNYCIIDEIDSILIDEARTPLIISGSAEDDTAKFRDVNNLVASLKECEKDPETGEYPEEPVGDFKIEEKSKRITFTEEGMQNIEKLLLGRSLIHGSLYLEENFEYIHYFTQALKAHHLFHPDVDYVVKEGQVQIVDEFTGRILYGRRYSDGLHQAIEAKAGIKVAHRNRTLATITFQNFFRLYDKISGMTGTADTEAKEFAKIYDLDVVVVPSNRPLARLDEDDVIYLNEEWKFNAICEEIDRAHKKGQPILVGTISIEKSEKLAHMLSRLGIRHEVLNAKNHAREALIIAEAGAAGSVTIATNMAGRGTDIKLGGSPEFRARKSVGTDAAPEEYQKVYDSEYKKWKQDYEKVKNAGGLYVIGTERHESRRIDNQLRGRSGRQGDPGESRFFISLDDDLMRLFGDNLKNMMSKIGMTEKEPIFHPWINKAIERAQTKVEERNYEVRKHLLEYDDVLNEQRKFIYSQRDEILRDSELVNRVHSATEDIVSDILDVHSRTQETPKTAMTSLLEVLKETFLYLPAADVNLLEKMPPEKLNALFTQELQKEIEGKVEQVGKENLNSFIRFEYLRSIDSRWQEHLENLESLREAVYLRSYGQKNPLLEYKLEGFQIFDELIQSIRETIAKKVHKVQIQQKEETASRHRRFSPARASHSALNQFGGRDTPQGSEPAKVQIKRSQPKVGRNDLCPCGSGKKYKHCHGI